MGTCSGLETHIPHPTQSATKGMTGKAELEDRWGPPRAGLGADEQVTSLSRCREECLPCVGPTPGSGNEEMLERAKCWNCTFSLGSQVGAEERL